MKNYISFIVTTCENLWNPEQAVASIGLWLYNLLISLLSTHEFNESW